MKHRRAVVMVGHNGPLTGTWWRDSDGLLDEFALAQKVAIQIAFALDARSWDTALYAMVDGYPSHLYQKGRALDQWRPSLGIEVHFNAFPKAGDRAGRWEGADAPTFREHLVPNESDRASGVSVCYLRTSLEGKRLSELIVENAAVLTDLGTAIGDGLDDRPQSGKTSLYLTHRVDPGYRRKRHPTPGWPGCPVVLLEAAALTHPNDREVLRNDPHIFSKIGRAVGEACETWLLEQWSHPSPA